MSDPERVEKTPDALFEQWRSMRDAFMASWSKTMIEGVNTDAYAKATGAMLDMYLTASAPFREALEKAMVQALQELHMPSQADVTVLAGRLTNIELRLDDLDIKLDRIAEAMGKAASSSPRLTQARRNVKKEPQ